jgi:hypothetical protein
MDLTQKDPKKMETMFGQPIPFGTAIAAPWCLSVPLNQRKERRK